MRARSSDVGRTAFALGTGVTVLVVTATMATRVGLTLSTVVRRRPD